MLGIGWGMSGTTAPFSSMGAAGLVLDIHNPSIGARHHLVDGMRVVDLTTLPMAPTLAPADGRAIYGIAVGADIKMFTSFAEFSTELASQLGGGWPGRAGDQKRHDDQETGRAVRESAVQVWAASR